MNVELSRVRVRPTGGTEWIRNILDREYTNVFAVQPDGSCVGILTAEQIATLRHNHGHVLSVEVI